MLQSNLILKCRNVGLLLALSHCFRFHSSLFSSVLLSVSVSSEYNKKILVDLQNILWNYAILSLSLSELNEIYHHGSFLFRLFLVFNVLIIMLFLFQRLSSTLAFYVWERLVEGRI